MKKEADKILFWTPRILSIFFIIFLTFFSLDVFELGLSFWQIALGLFIHNIPSIVLIILLTISWKHEIVGAVTFFVAGLLYIGLLFTSSDFEWYMLSWSMIISGPAFLIGSLFLTTWKRRK